MGKQQIFDGVHLGHLSFSSESNFEPWGCGPGVRVGMAHA